MKLEGEIWELDLIPQLVELGSQSFTGAIRFENDSVIKIVYFKDGNVLSASTNDRADSIDEILLKSGKVTREHVKQALSKRKETETLGDALLGLGFIAKRELAWARRVQLIGILRSISEWKSGTFTVVADYLPKREEGTSFPLPQVVLELVLTDQDRPKYDRLLESGSVVFRKSASFDGAFSSLGLNQEAAGIASRIDGILTASEVASESGSDAFNVYKLLNALNLLGLVEKTEKLLEVSPAPVGLPVGFGEPASPTVEMALDFGGGGAAAPAEEIGRFPENPTPVEPEVGEFVSDSSVPAGDLMGYDFDAPAPDVEELGLDYVAPAEQPAPPVPVAANPPSDGLSSLESFRNFEVPASQFPAIEDRIAQRQEKSKPLSAPPARGGRKTGLIAAAAIAVIAIAVAAGWFFLHSRQQDAPVPVAQTTPPRTTTSAPPAARSATGTSDTAGQGEVPTATSVASTVPATTSSSPAPVPVPSTTTRAPEPKPVPPPPAQQVKPPVVPTAKAPVAAPPVVAAAPSSSKYATQARQFEKEAAGVPFTVQFELVCRDASVEKAMSVGGAKIWFLPISYRGEQCYRVFWGRYSNRADAERAVSDIPASLRGGKPSVVSPGAGR